MASSVLERLAVVAHTSIFRISRGRLGSRISKTPVLLLTTTGRTTGKKRTVPLLYLADADSYAVIASHGGADVDPAWCRNLRASPAATVQIGDSHVAVEAEFVEGAERDRLWHGLTATYAGYDGYAGRTTRVIPVVRLRPV
jgi:deazaflavin-dependent oxidoreductase (nitroreductase family)